MQVFFGREPFNTWRSKTRFKSWCTAAGIGNRDCRTLRSLASAAHAKALTSPELIAEAKKQGLEPEHIPGEEMEALAKEVLNAPPEVVSLIKGVGRVGVSRTLRPVEFNSTR